MIAQPSPHFDIETLRQLIDESLPRETMRQIEEHLSRCDHCRDALEEIAGQRHWWTETAEILAESTVGSGTAKLSSPQPLSSLDASLDWIRPLMGTVDDESMGIGRIDHYIVQGVIGQGGMGVVLRGIDCELNRPVAIKVLSPHLAGVGAARARFMREAQAAAAVVHPSIVPIYSVVTSARLPYIVMPSISGGNLQQRIDREGPLEIGEVLRIGLQIAEGLAAAHRHGVIHRDIKPANILVEEGNGRVLISDFGLARALDDATLTISGMIAGTPQFMSPEQARGEPIDARSDLFSFGSLLYSLATGRPPYRAESPLAVLRKISETSPRPIHQVNERIPPWLDNLVAQLMQIDVRDRVGTADEAAALLREAHAHVRNPSANALPKALARRSNATRWAIVAAFLIVPICTSALAYTLFASYNDATPPNANDNPAAMTADAPEPAMFWRDPSLESELISIGATLDALAADLEFADQSQQFSIDQSSTDAHSGERNDIAKP